MKGLTWALSKGQDVLSGAPVLQATSWPLVLPAERGNCPSYSQLFLQPALPAAGVTRAVPGPQAVCQGSAPLTSAGSPVAHTLPGR